MYEGLELLSLLRDRFQRQVSLLFFHFSQNYAEYLDYLERVMTHQAGSAQWALPFITPYKN
jgi:hypothetical protein